MATNYDDIAEQYKRSKEVIWRYHIEQYSLCQLLGDISGLSLLDLACGDGHYTRLLRALGASRVVGVDNSRKMIELAEAAERDHPVGIAYVVADAQTVSFLERFDVVMAAYLLNYARSKEELLAMYNAISRNLRPGGRFVAINNNPAQRVSSFQATRKYGFVKNAQGELRNGTPIRYTFFMGNETFELENYHLDVGIHASALAQTGFSEIQWHSPKLSPAEAAVPDQEYWTDFLADPPVILLECRKQSSS